MPLLARISSLARNLFCGERVERELDEEVSGYLGMLRDEKVRAGRTPAEAAREAAIELEGAEQVKEAVRDVRAGHALENLWQDARFGARMLARTPGFTAVAVLSLALGLGGNAAMFSLIYGVLIRPLPYPQPERLVRVTDYYPKGAVAALQQRSRTLDVAAYTDSEFNLTGQGEAARLAGSAVSASLFSMLGVRPELGRAFAPGEDQPGRDRIAVISHSLWQGKFGGDPAIIGRTVTIDGVDRVVVGVAYGVISYSAAQRTYEMGVRIALGATPAGVFGLVLRQSLRIVLAGLAVGLVASAALARLLSRFLYGVTATDPATFVAVSALLVAVGFVAGHFPARRAARVDPLTALRVE
jgi:hypothetical protein